jgi:toxin YoeB
MSRRVLFESGAFNDFNDWATSNKKVHKKIIELIKNIDRTPHEGLGKPEALKYEYQGYWSRRITEEHRLVYKVTETEILIASCKYHYESS